MVRGNGFNIPSLYTFTLKELNATECEGLAHKTRPEPQLDTTHWVGVCKPWTGLLDWNAGLE